MVPLCDLWHTEASIRKPQKGRMVHIVRPCPPEQRGAHGHMVGRTKARAYHECSEACSGWFHAFFAVRVCGCARRTLSSSQRGAERIGAIETILIPLLGFLPLCDRWHYDCTYFSKIIKRFKNIRLAHYSTNSLIIYEQNIDFRQNWSLIIGHNWRSAAALANAAGWRSLRWNGAAIAAADRLFRSNIA